MSPQEHLQYKTSLDKLDDNASHIQIFNKVPANAVVLDVGCACGDMGAYLVQHKNCTMLGLEYNEQSINVARATNAYTHIIQVDLNTNTPFPAQFTHAFDCIILGDILEHLYQPEQVLAQLLPLLNDEGRMVVSLPNIAHGSIATQILLNKFTYMNYGILDKTHIRFFTYESIAHMMADMKLKIMSSTKTIWDLPGLHPYNPLQLLPLDLVTYIAANPHAYVLQYVFEAVLSKHPISLIRSHNLHQLTTFTPEEEARIQLLRNNLPPAS